MGLQSRHGLTVVPATRGLIRDIAQNLRKEDVEECRAASGLPPQVGIHYGAAKSEEVWCAVDGGGAPLAIWGVVRTSPGAGRIWLLASDGLRAHRREVIERGQAYLDDIQSRFLTVYNLVDARNTLHIHWLRRAGFTLFDPVPHGPRGLPFIPFVRFANIV